MTEIADQEYVLVYRREPGFAGGPVYFQIIAAKDKIIAVPKLTDAARFTKSQAVVRSRQYPVIDNEHLVVIICPITETTAYKLGDPL